MADGAALGRIARDADAPLWRSDRKSLNRTVNTTYVCTSPGFNPTLEPN